MPEIVFIYVCTRCGFISEGDKCDTHQEAQTIFRNTVVGVNLDSGETDRKVPEQRICQCAGGGQGTAKPLTGQGVARLVGWSEGGIGCTKLL